MQIHSVYNFTVSGDVSLSCNIARFVCDTVTDELLYFIDWRYKRLVRAAFYFLLCACTKEYEITKLYKRIWTWKEKQQTTRYPSYHGEASLIRFVNVFWSFQLNFKSFHPNLKSIHRLYCRVSARRIVKTHETCQCRHRQFVSSTRHLLNSANFSVWEISVSTNLSAKLPE